MSIEKNAHYSKRYNPPRKFPAAGRPILFIFLATLICLGLDLFVGAKFFAGEGPLSSAHSLMNGECKNCHTQKWTRSNISMELQCTRCHQDNKPLQFHIAAYTEPGDKKRKVKQTFCMDCHQEHRGHEFSSANISDQSCRNCHGIHDTGRDHPEFNSEKLESNHMNSIGLQFSHLSHQKKEKNSEEMNRKFEKGCFLCHQLDPAQGFMDFKPARFEENCKDCHELQELALTWMFEEDTLDGIAESIQGLARELGFESYDSFLSRFEYRKADKRRRRPASFQYAPVHRDPYLKIWFSAGREGIEDRIKTTLAKGKKGTTLNCLKCHVLEEGGSEDKDRYILSKKVFLGKVQPETGGSPPVKFFHKRHAGQRCDTCHTGISQSKSLTDANIQVTRTGCFNCHNKQTVNDKCSYCHSFHQSGDQRMLTRILFSTRNNELPFPQKGNRAGGGS